MIATQKLQKCKCSLAVVAAAAGWFFDRMKALLSLMIIHQKYIHIALGINTLKKPKRSKTKHKKNNKAKLKRTPTNPACDSKACD